MPAISSPMTARCFDRAGRDLRMHAIGHVGRGATGAQIRVAANQHARAGGTRSGVKPCSASTARAMVSMRILLSAVA